MFHRTLLTIIIYIVLALEIFKCYFLLQSSIVNSLSKFQFSFNSLNRILTNISGSEDSGHYDDVFRNRFIMDDEETERMKAIERRCTRIPDIKKTGSIIVSLSDE